MRRGSTFTCGPFADVKERIEDFGTALYFSQLYYETILQHQELVIQLTEAQKDNDEELVKEIEQQICFIENLCTIENFIELPNSEN